MRYQLKTYCKRARRFFIRCIFLLSFSILQSCVSYYHIDNSQSLYKPTVPYGSFWFLITISDGPKIDILQLLDSGLESNLRAMGLEKDSLKPDLLFIIRWETHLIGLHSFASNTTSQVKSKASGDKIRYNQESFYRIQAIDAIKNELVWSVKIYPPKRKSLQADNIPQIMRDLTLSFAQVQFNDYKMKTK